VNEDPRHLGKCSVFTVRVSSGGANLEGRCTENLRGVDR
jgi:hypothetical protein